jgi:hypothetical protein
VVEGRYRRNTKALWGLTLLAIAYSAWFYCFDSLTGSSILDGAFSIVLGLYICSRPAANAIDLLFLERGAFRRAASGWASIRWLALNILTLLVGWIVIFIGTSCFTGRSA